MAGSDRDKSLTTRRLGIREFRGNMASFLRQARDVSTFLLTSRDEVVAEIHPPSKFVPPHRRPGALRGRIHMTGNFDALPSDVLAAMEGEEG